MTLLIFIMVLNPLWSWVFDLGEDDGRSEDC